MAKDISGVGSMRGFALAKWYDLNKASIRNLVSAGVGIGAAIFAAIQPFSGAFSPAAYAAIVGACGVFVSVSVKLFLDSVDYYFSEVVVGKK